MTNDIMKYISGLYAVELETTPENEWHLWYDKRPENPDSKKLYRWRIKDIKILNRVLTPEWTETLHLCGMGYSESEYWPVFSDWNGYVRSVPKNLEWREAKEDEPKGEVIYHGLNLLPNPFTGLPPKITGNTRWIGSGPWRIDCLNIESYMVKSYGWADIDKMEAAWNKRV